MPKTTPWWLFALAIVCGTLALDKGSARALPGDTIADRVLGQTVLTADGVNIAKPNGMYNPAGIAVDNSGATPNPLYVADTQNNRVLGWHDAAGFANGAAPDLVFGQPNSTSVHCGTAANRLCAPRGVAVDSKGDLLVADTGNSRVLVFKTPFMFGTNAAFVLGQSIFTTKKCGLSMTAMCDPNGVWADASGNVWVADTTNHRVLKFKGPGIANGEAASLVLGQLNFTSGKCNRGGAKTSATLCFPHAVAVDKSGHVYVSDATNDRVLEFNAPSVSGVAANLVLGGPGCNATTSGSLCEPQGVWVDNTSRLWVADAANARVLEYNTPLTNVNASRVFGQNNNFSNALCPPNLHLDATGLCEPEAVAVQTSSVANKDNVYIVDDVLNRALGYNAPLNSATPPKANRVLGQLDFAHDGVNIPNAHSLFNPRGIALDTSLSPTRLYVADTGNNRILRWNSVPSFLSGAAANLVLGQPDFLHVDSGTGPNSGISEPTGLAVHNGDLWVADAGNNRVIRFKAPVNAGAAFDVSLGQANLGNNQCNIGGINSKTLCFPTGLGFDSTGRLYVADQGNNRVLVYSSLVTNASAIKVFRQASSSGLNSCNRGGSIGALGLCEPQDVALDGANNLYIDDLENSRVVEYNPGATSPSHVYGEPDFTHNTGCFGASNTSLCLPRGVRVDSVRHLLVADGGYSRVLRYFNPLSSSTANQVFGQSSFVGNGCGVSTTASRLCNPNEAVADAAGNVYIADTNNNRVLEYDKPPN